MNPPTAIRLTRIALAVALPVVSCQLSLADTVTWTGILSSFWGNSANWSPGSVPSSDADLLFDGGAFLFTIDLGAQNRTAASITIDSATAYTFEDSIPGQSLLTSSIAVESGTGHSFAVPIVLTADGTFFVRTDLGVSGVISGAYSLSKQSEGTLTLTGANTYSGGTIIQGGTLQVGDGGTSGSILGDVDTGDADAHGTLAFNRSDDITFDGLITGSGGLTQSGAGSLTLTAANTFGGATHINAGSIVLGHGSALQNSTVNINVANGLDLGGADAPLGALAGSGGLALAGGITLTVGGNGADTTYSGVLSGSGALTKTGAGDLTLSGNNTFTGDTRIDGGRIVLSGAVNRSLQHSTAYLNVDGGLYNSGNSDIYLGGLAGAGNLSISNNTEGFYVGANGADTTYSGAITGGGSANLFKEGAGTWTLTGTGHNTTMQIQVSAGSLIFDGASGTFAKLIPISGSQMQLRNGANITSNLRVEGGSVLVTGTGTYLQSANGFTNYGAVTIEDGAILESASNSMPSGGTLTIRQATGAFGLLSGLGGDRIYLADPSGGAALTLGGDGNNGLFEGVIADVDGADPTNGIESVKKIGSNTQVLTGANTYSGGTTILGGTLQIGNGGTSGSLLGDVDTGDADANGTLAFNRSDAISFDGLITGSGDLTQSGSGSLTLNAANTFTGATNINAGSIILGHASALQNSTVNINVADGLDLNGTDATLGALAGSGSLSLPDATTLSVGGNGADTTYSGVLSGSGALTKTGAGTLTLSGANPFSGATTINEGSILLVETDYYNRSLQNSTVTLNVDGGLDLGTVNDASLGALAGGGDLSFQDVEVHVGANNASTTYSGVFTSGTTTLYKEGTGTWTLTGSGFTDGTLVIDEGTVVFDGAAGRLYSITADGGTLTLTNGTNLSLSNDLEGTGDIEINGAATRVSAATLHVYGPVNVADGAEVSVTNDLSFLNNKTLTIDQATVLAVGFSSSFAGSKIQLSDAEGASALTINGDSNSTFVGVISDHTSGPGSLLKTGSGTLTLTGANTYSGGTIISGGVLAVDGDSLADAGKLVIDGGKVNPMGATEVVGALYFGATRQAAGNWGATGSGADHIDDTRFTGTGVISVTGTYSDWAETNAGGQTADQDYDHDGVPNAVEYFMGETGSSFTANPGLIDGTITWPRNPAFDGTYRVETSPDLSTWTDVTDSVIDDGSSVTHTLATGAGKWFIRLVVTLL